MPIDDPTVANLLTGAVDAHIHTGPDAFERHDTDFTIARKARAHDMAGLVIKSHHFETGARARLVTEEIGVQVRGGITLNVWAGGLNPLAVDGAAALGASVVWMPTITAANHIASGGGVPHLDDATDDSATVDGISVLDADGSLRNDALAVLDRIAANDMCLALGHLAPDEAMPMARAGVDRGVRNVICHHPHAEFLGYSIEQLREIVDLGGTVELHYGSTTGMMGEAVTIADLADTARAIGPANTVLATDGGATVNPPIMTQWVDFLQGLLDAGLEPEEIRPMLRDNPKALYRIP